jgi:hypothetical protein
MKKIVKYLPIVLTVLFMLFVIVQYNDPDPFVWMIIYGFTSLSSLLVFFNRMSKTLLLIAMPFYLAGAVYLWPGTYEGISMSMGYKPHIELARESLGLLICFLAMVFLYFQVGKQNKEHRAV